MSTLTRRGGFDREEALRLSDGGVDWTESGPGRKNGESGPPNGEGVCQEDFRYDEVASPTVHNGEGPAGSLGKLGAVDSHELAQMTADVGKPTEIRLYPTGIVLSFSRLPILPVQLVSAGLFVETSDSRRDPLQSQKMDEQTSQQEEVAG